MMLSDDELLRYSRQIMLPAIDIAGQEALKRGTVLIVGAGGLGSPVVMYLAAAGVGKLVLSDDDVVETSNLQRQIAHSVSDLGLGKAASAAATARRLSPAVTVEVHDSRLEGEALDQTVAAVDVVVDCSDNFATRFALNRACLRHRVPLVSGAAIRFEGQLSVFDFRRGESPCYACLYGEGEELDLNCSDNGVVAPLVGIIGSWQALEAIKLLTAAGEAMVGKLLLLDALGGDCRVLALKRNPACAVCSVELADSHLDPEQE